MSAAAKIIFVVTIFFGAWITWELLCLGRTQIVALISRGRFEFRDAISEGLFVVEGLGLFIWVVMSGLPSLFVAEAALGTTETFRKGANGAIVFCIIGLVFSIGVFFFLKPSKGITHYQNLGITKSLIPRETKKRFIPGRYSDFDNEISETGRKAVDALVLGQLVGVVAIASIFWIKFSDKVLNKDEYDEGESGLDWISIMRRFHDNDPPEDEDELEF